MNRWFTYYLFGIDNGVEKDARAFIVRENDENPTAYKDYPNHEAQDVTFYLTKGAPTNGGLSLEKIRNGIKETLVDNYSFSGSELVHAEITNHRLLYVSPTLSEDVHISGVPSILITLSSSKPAANLSVWLVSLPWIRGSSTRIFENIITRGWADPQNHQSIRESEPLDEGTFYVVKFDLMPDDQIIPRGQKIGLLIFSSDREFTLWPEPGTELTVDLDKTTVTLPIVGGQGKIAAAFMK